MNPSGVKYICDICGKGYTRKSKMLCHREVHSQQSTASTIISESSHVTVGTGNNSNNTTVNIQNLVLERNYRPFLEKLIRIHGDERKVFQHLKQVVHEQIKGEVKLFGDMYMSGDDPEKWSVVCVDAKTHFFKIRQPDGSWVDDPGAIKSKRLFYNNYTDSVLFLMDGIVFQRIVDQNVDGDDYDYRAGTLMDHTQIDVLQERLHHVCSSSFRQNLFASELAKHYHQRIRDVKNRTCDVRMVVNGHLNRMGKSPYRT